MKQELTCGKRWYDTAPHIRHAFESFRVMPSDYRQHFVELLDTVTSKMKADNKKYGDIKSMGSDRTTGWIKAREKKRVDDRDPVLHRALVNLFLLSDEQRSFLATRISISVSCMDLYQEACRRQGKMEKLNELMQIINAVIAKGLSAAQLHFYRADLIDDKMHKRLVELGHLFNEELTDIRPPVEVPQVEELPVSAMEVHEETIKIRKDPPPAAPSSPPREKKHRDRLLADDQGMKLSRADLDD